MTPKLLFTAILGGALFAPLSFSTVPALAQDANTARFLKNADFGAPTLAGWKLASGAPGAKISRDDVTFQGGPASLKIEVSGGAASVQSELWARVPSAEFTVSGFYKTSGTLEKADLIAQSLDARANWGGVDWVSLASLQNATEWTPFSAKVRFGEKGNTALFHLQLSGNGTLWLDSLRLQTADAPAISASADGVPIASQRVRLLPANLQKLGQVQVHGGGTVTYLTQNPNFPDQLLAAMDVSGPMSYDYKTRSWTPLADAWGPENTGLLHCELIALDPQNPRNILYSAGKEWQSGAPSIVRSTDGGKSWKNFPLKRADGKAAFITNGRRGEGLQFDPNNSQIAFYGSRQDGLFTSNDGGATWSQKLDFPRAGAIVENVRANWIAFDKKSGTRGAATPTIYVYAQPSKADVPFERGIYRSTDAGKSWQKLPDTPKAAWCGRIMPDGKLYAYGQGLYRWDDGKWTDLSPQNAKYAIEAFAQSHGDPNLMVAVENHCGWGNALLRTTDGGKSWERFSDDDAFGRGKNLLSIDYPGWEGGNTGKHIFACASSANFDKNNPKKVWVTHWPGVISIDDITAPRLDWTSEGKGHEEICLFDLATPTRGVPLLSGSMDVGGLVHESIHTPPSQMFVGLAMSEFNRAPEDLSSLDFCEAQPEFIAAVGGWKYKDWGPQPANNGAAGFSADGGKTWQNFASKPFGDAKNGRIRVNSGNPDNIVWIPRDSLDGANKGTTPAYVTFDRGKSWKSAQGAPFGIVNSDFVYTFFQPLESDRVLADTFYLYDRRDGRFFRSGDGGASWKQTAELPSQGGAHFVRHWVRAAPGKAGEVWVAADNQGLFRSSDGGNSFTKLEGVSKAWAFGWGAPFAGNTTPVAYLLGKVEGDTTPQTVALYRSLDMGASWERLNGPEQGFGQGIVVQGDRQTPGRVYVGTNGRGIFYADTPNPNAPRVANRRNDAGKIALGILAGVLVWRALD